MDPVRRPGGHAVDRVDELVDGRQQGAHAHQRRAHRDARASVAAVRGRGPVGGLAGHRVALRHGVHRVPRPRLEALRGLVARTQGQGVQLQRMYCTTASVQPDSYCTHTVLVQEVLVLYSLNVLVVHHSLPLRNRDIRAQATYILASRQ